MAETPVRFNWWLVLTGVGLVVAGIVVYSVQFATGLKDYVAGILSGAGVTVIITELIDAVRRAAEAQRHRELKSSVDQVRSEAGAALEPREADLSYLAFWAVFLSLLGTQHVPAPQVIAGMRATATKFGIPAETLRKFEEGLTPDGTGPASGMGGERMLKSALGAHLHDDPGRAIYELVETTTGLSILFGRIISSAVQQGSSVSLDEESLEWLRVGVTKLRSDLSTVQRLVSEELRANLDRALGLMESEAVALRNEGVGPARLAQARADLSELMTVLTSIVDPGIFKS